MSAFTVLGLDVGVARIGVAVSDTSGRFAFPRGYIVRQKLALDIVAVKAQMDKEHAQTVVIGLPLKTDGTYSGQTQRVRAFAKDLERAGIDVQLQDERFSTKLAQSQLLVISNKRDRLEKGLLDAQSAVLILETYLARVAVEKPQDDPEP
jgi:putative holliday junction resolvase